MDRRQFLASGSSAALASTMAAPAVMAAVQPAPRSAPGDVTLNAVFDRIFNRQVATSPTLATTLGLDKGEWAELRRTFDAKPYPQARAEDVARLREANAAIEAIPLATLSPAAKLNREITLYDIDSRLIAPTRFDLDSVQRPYLINQQDGAYFNIPDFLDSAHPVENRDDAEAYLSRLAEFPRLLDFEMDEQKRQAGRGYLAPAWALELALGQIAKLREQPAASGGMVESLRRRTAEKKIAGDWSARAARIVDAQVYPALDRHAAALRALLPTTAPGDGATRLPRHEELYAAALAQATTTSMSPEEVHQLGLAQVAEYSAKLDPLLRQAGYTKGTVGERLAALGSSPEQVFTNTDAGRAQLLASLNAAYRKMRRSCRRPSRQSRPSRWRSGESRPRSRMARPTATITAHRWMARGPPSTGSTSRIPPTGPNTGSTR